MNPELKFNSCGRVSKYH